MSDAPQHALTAGSGTAPYQPLAAFGLHLAQTRPVLALPPGGWRLPPGLFPEAAPPPSYVAVRNKASMLRVRHAFLRAPPTRDGRRVLLSATLSDGACWGQRLLEHPLDPAMAGRAAALVSQLRAARVGGAWWGAAPPVQVAGRALVFAAGPLTGALLRHALARTDAARTVLVGARGREAARAHRMGVVLAKGVLDPWPLVEQAASVQAAPWSDPWLLAGLMGPDAARLAAAGLIRGARYVDPFTLAQTSCEQFLSVAAEWRRQHEANAKVACCVGISFWKRRRVTQMLGAARPPAFRKNAQAAISAAARRGGAIAVWPSRAPQHLAELAVGLGIPVMQVEDGFVRSAGLGADFLPPLSLVLDGAGIYYDATRPSDLEALLASAAFAPELLRRAAALRLRLVQGRVTKYNLPSAPPATFPAGRIVLVPGQVADDRSVLLGGGGVLPGLDLLQRVRRQLPAAHIVYKPHPDVEAGHRPGAVPDAAVLRLADQVVRGGSMADLLGMVDEVHTLTSLTGFEALLRGIAVTTYGQPFYAGWGLTTDMNAPARRVRRLELDELVAGTMILYPRYYDPVSGLACGPETVLDRLADPALRRALRRAGPLVMARRLHGRMRRLQIRLADMLWAARDAASRGTAP